MPTPNITNFGDESHEEGETGLTVDGFDFGFWAGELWMFANADRSGASDQLTVGGWSDWQLTGVEIPVSPTNVPGTVYLAAKTAEGLWSSPAFPYSFTLVSAGAASAVLTGTAADGLLEAEIVAGGETVIITLTNDTWVAAGAAFNAIRQDIIDGMDSAQSELTGWNAEVRDKEVVGAVVRTSDTVVTITLTAAAAYDVVSNEVITVTVPATAVVGAAPITATPTFTVTALVVPAVSGKKRGASTSATRRRREVKILPKEQHLLPFEAALLNIEIQEALDGKRKAVLTKQRARQIAMRSVKPEKPKALGLISQEKKVIIIEQEDKLILEVIGQEFL